MKFKIDQLSYDESVRAYFEDYFKAKSAAPDLVSASKIHVYGKRPREGSPKPAELQGSALRGKLESTEPVFVTCGDDDSGIAAFCEYDGMIYSGNDLAALIEREEGENKLTTVMPKETQKPGGFSRKLYAALGYKTKSYRAFEEYETKKAEFQRAIDMEQGRIVSCMNGAGEKDIARALPERSRAGLGA